MSAPIRKLGLNTLGLGLILSLHLGILNFEGMYAWAKLITSELVLLSLFVLSAAYAAAFRLGRALHEKEQTRASLLYTGTTAGLILLLYIVFFAPERLAQVIASTFLFLVVISIAAFCKAGETTAWKNLYRALQASLLLAVPAIFYPYPEEEVFRPGPEYRAEKSIIRTALYNVELTEYSMPTPIPELSAHIGALDDKTFLKIDYHGGIYHLSLRKSADNDSTEEEFHFKKLAVRLPTHRREFLEANLVPDARKFGFRIHDLFIDTEDGQRRLYFSHNFWNAERECSTLRITKLVGSVSSLLEDDATPGWRTLYETAPCLPLKTSSHLFASHQSGGRIVGLDENTLLFSVGDFGFDMLNAARGVSQELDGAYGKIWKIDRDTGAAEPFSIGHRNPQGLYRASDGTIWETEHGPRGGDELNRVEPGKNYGWPLVTYGTDYYGFTWSPGVSQNAHEGYEHPAFAWTPSVGVSNLVRVERDLFPLWKHNLLVGSLTGQTLFRLQMRGNRVIYDEPIYIGWRIRDITETSSGEIFMWAGADRSRALLRLRPADPRPN